MACNEPGKVISATDAQLELTLYNKILNDNRKIIDELIETITGKFPQLENYLKLLLHSSRKFVFHKDHVTRFFCKACGEEHSEATHLVIMNGVKLNKDNPYDVMKWEPTVIIMGCSEKVVEGTPQYFCLDKTKYADLEGEASEQPTSGGAVMIPGPGFHDFDEEKLDLEAGDFDEKVVRFVNKLISVQEENNKTATIYSVI